ncbi:MAG: hypothetical protein IT186_06900 [Acidobacteria bacterium]|nr:hypothetical protein [Acidobacteriota bacterium]
MPVTGPIPPSIAAIAPDGKLTPRERRRLKLEMVRRRSRPGTGSSLGLLRQRTAMINWPDLREILRGLPWAIVGGVATRAYMPERMTQDLDVLVHANDSHEAVRRMEAAGYRFEGPLTFPGVILRSPEGIEVDLLFGGFPWVHDALGATRPDPAGYPVVALPYLVLLKMWATRDQDWTDITRMLGLASEEDLEAVRGVIASFSPEESDDLETMIFLGKQEISEGK